MVTFLLDKGLIACANIMPDSESYFYWERDIQKAKEVVVFIKTTSKNEDKIIKLVSKYHSYDTPCVVFTPIVSGDDKFCKWVDKTC